LQQTTTGPTAWTNIVTNDIWLDPSFPAWCCLRRHWTESESRFGKPPVIHQCPI